MALLMRILLASVVIGLIWYVWAGVKADRRKKIYDELINLGAAAAIDVMRSFIQSRPPQGLKAGWLFYVRYFAIRLAWFNTRACAIFEKVKLHKKLTWEITLNQHTVKLMQESEGNPDVFSKINEFNERTETYIKKVVAIGGGFAIGNCRKELAEILKQHLVISSTDDSAVFDSGFEEAIATAIEACGETIRQGIKLHRKQLK